jgi:hypothetical protein
MRCAACCISEGEIMRLTTKDTKIHEGEPLSLCSFVFLRVLIVTLGWKDAR